MSELQTAVFIGRDPNTSKIGAFMTPSKYTLLDEIADNCVSRYKPQEQTAHCKLEIYKDGTLKLINLNPSNITYANGTPIQRAWIDENTYVELGYGRYHLPLQLLLKKIGWKKPYVINHLKIIYQDYQDAILALQLKQQRDSAKQRLQGIFSLLGMLVLLIPDSVFGGGEMTRVLKFIFTGAALLCCVYFTIRSFNPKNTFVIQKTELDRRLKEQYRCPNKECNRPFPVTMSYDNLVMSRRCPFCESKFVEKKVEGYVNHSNPNPYIQHVEPTFSEAY